MSGASSTKRKPSATSRSVRDHAQSARIIGEKCIVTSYVGRTKVASYSFALRQFEEAWKECPGNPRHAERQLLANFFSGDRDCQAERIIDAQYYAVRDAMAHRAVG